MFYDYPPQMFCRTSTPGATSQLLQSSQSFIKTRYGLVFGIVTFSFTHTWTQWCQRLPQATLTDMVYGIVPSLQEHKQMSKMTAEDYF